jgi:hypothetical protein
MESTRANTHKVKHVEELFLVRSIEKRKSRVSDMVNNFSWELQRNREIKQSFLHLEMDKYSQELLPFIKAIFV